MSIFPFLSIPNNLDLNVENSNKELELYKEIKWDFVKNEPVLVNGDFVIVEGNEAIKTWCYKAINTVRYQYQVYSWDYGCEIIELTGQQYTKGLTKSEAERYIKECLLINPYISDVKVTDISFNSDRLGANIEIKTIYGEVNMDV